MGTWGEFSVIEDGGKGQRYVLQLSEASEIEDWAIQCRLSRHSSDTDTKSLLSYAAARQHIPMY